MKKNYVNYQCEKTTLSVKMEMATTVYLIAPGER